MCAQGRRVIVDGMKLGYPTTNLALGCTSAKTFRLASFTPERFAETLGNNLLCLAHTLRFNAAHDLRFFRLTSDLVPFASHPVCDIAWGALFARQFAALGAYARQEDMRLSMHPGQYTIINTADDALFGRSLAELVYHAEVFDRMAMDATHKLQIHVGGIYGDRAASLERFVARHAELPEAVRRRLVVENDDRLYSLRDCLWLHAQIGIPVVFDVFHHALLNHGEPLADALRLASATWGEGDGVLMVDYSTQAEGARAGTHADGLDADAFVGFLETARASGCDFDLMFELKDKEAPALAALALVRTHYSV